MKRLLVVHHSHTDIGYTEPQARIARWHADFIRQALEIAWESFRQQPALDARVGARRRGS